jgi:threonine 3-dehydrogenase
MTPNTMLAVRKAAREPGLHLERVPTPTIRDDEVLVRVEAASVCGTDLHIHAWDEWAQHRLHPPLTIGHEFCGTVVARGDAVRHIHSGAYVSAESHVTCGMCFHCRTGHAHMCPHTQILGVDRDGALAEYVAVPESVIWENDRSRLPREIATLQEPFGNAVYATSEQDLAGQSVAVLGCGPIGLFAIAIANARGAAGVWAADRVEHRLEMARQMGATGVVNTDQVNDLPGWFHAQNRGAPIDIVFEMSGAAPAITASFPIARNGGRVILFGIPSRPVEIDVAESLIFKNLSVLALNGRKVFDTWYKTRWLLESGRVDLRPLVTTFTGLDDHETAFRTLRDGNAAKIVFLLADPPATAATSAEASPRREPAAEPKPPLPMAARRPRYTHG